MSFIIDMLEKQLGLTEQERPAVEQAMPIVAHWIRLLNSDWDTLLACLNLFVKAQPVMARLIADCKLLGPVAEDVIDGSGGMMEAMGAIGPAKDMQATVQANPYLLKTGSAYYGKLRPLFEQIVADWPKVEPAWNVLAPKLGIH